MRAFASVTIGLLALAATPALAARTAADGGSSCEAAIGIASVSRNLPPGLLDAIALVESGRVDPATRSVRPWPWTINVDGTGYFYNTKAEAVAAVRVFAETSVKSIDVGCMQISLAYHPNAFTTLDQAFDPRANAAYAARFLDALHTQSGDWSKAAAAYHSQTPAIGEGYRQRVMANWPGHGVPGLIAPPVEDRQYTPEFSRVLADIARDRNALYARINGGRDLQPVVPVPRRAGSRPVMVATTRLNAAALLARP